MNKTVQTSKRQQEDLNLGSLSGESDILIASLQHPNSLDSNLVCCDHEEDNYRQIIYHNVIVID